jgi:hypothetical protein
LDRQYCIDYARNAAGSSAENTAKQCGFSGDLWSQISRTT